MLVRCAICAALVLVAGAATVSGGVGPPVYNPTPDWVSGAPQVSTGAALADLNRDGWLDLIVANGNDIAEQHVAVYHNRRDGTFPPLPDWQSDDLAYNGHLDVADVNGDGWPDIAVALSGEFFTKGPVARVYLNENGTLSRTPSWSADATGNAFAVTFGDVNGDGRPDLAVATGWAYTRPGSYHNLVYLNENGRLGSKPGWQSDDRHDYAGALWVDGDNDGWLDLIGVGTRTYTWLYRNDRGSLATAANWRTTDNGNLFAIMAAAGDVTGDGRRDLFVAENQQLCPMGGYVRAYPGNAAGDFATSWSWRYRDGYCSAVALADLNDDGRLDLATGAWFDKTRIFFNTGAGLPKSPGWSSRGASTVEKIVFGDINKDGLHPAIETFGPADGRRLFYLKHQPIQDITAIMLDGAALPPSQFTFSRDNGWVSVARTPARELRVEYTWSTRLDMAVTNWDNDVGNHVYYHQWPMAHDTGDDDSDSGHAHD